MALNRDGNEGGGQVYTKRKVCEEKVGNGESVRDREGSKRPDVPVGFSKVLALRKDRSGGERGGEKKG